MLEPSALPYFGMFIVTFVVAMIFLVAFVSNRRSHVLALKQEENRNKEALAMIEKGIVPPATVNNYY